MRSLISLLLLLTAAAQARVLHHYHVVGDAAEPWPAIFASVGLTPGAPDIVVIRQGEAAPVDRWMEIIRKGAIVVVEGDSELLRAAGFRYGAKRVAVRSLVDRNAPRLPIVWAKSLETAVVEPPPDAIVFTTERWSKAPLVAGLRIGEGAVLWVATAPGEQGFERYPYLLQALTALGFEAPLATGDLWAFFDTAYRLRVDPDYFAERWRRSGIGALHVAAWQHFERDPERDAYLERLIAACHRRAILVYAWFELPHVSERFWQDHPQWREKTALGQDAHLDWRKLMNLADPACFRAAAEGVHAMIARFDWDGVNLAELYFESLEGASNLARFTPFNATVEAEFRAAHGVSPAEALRQPATLRKFLDYRAELAHRLQRQWLDELARARVHKRDLDIVLTHIDDRMDKGMRDALGADAARLLPLMDQGRFTFLVEDPATLWHLGPDRYPKLWQHYRPLATQPERLAVDINIVERYQDVYPTKQQTGVELFQLVHNAAAAFPRVALYFENSILPQDAALLPSAAAHAQRLERVGSKLVVESAAGVVVRWPGAANVDGRPWPATDGTLLRLPAGPHVVEAAKAAPAMRLLDFNGRLRSALVEGAALEFGYENDARGIAILDKAPASVTLDGETVALPVAECARGYALTLPAGQHVVRVEAPAAN